MTIDATCQKLGLQLDNINWNTIVIYLPATNEMKAILTNLSFAI